MFQYYQDFHYKVKGLEKAEKIPSEAFKHQTLKNVNSCMKKAQGSGHGLFGPGLKCHSQSAQAAHRAVTLPFSSAVNLLKLQKQGWEEYYSVRWRIGHRMFSTSSFLDWKLYWHNEPTLEKKSNACYQMVCSHKKM